MSAQIVGRGPHPLADLGSTAEAAREARRRRCCPRTRGSTTASRISGLRTIGPASIEVWISSPVRSRNPVLMNAMRSRAACTHALRLAEVRRSSSMIPSLMVRAGRPRSLLDTGEHVADERHLIRAVQLRLHHVDGAHARVAQAVVAAQVVQAAQAADQRVEQPLRNPPAAPVEHRIGGDQQPDLTDEQQRPAWQAERLPRPP